MNFLPDSSVSNRLTLSTGLFVAAWGLLIIVGWHIQNIALTQLHETWKPMAYDTALGLSLCGAGLVGASLGSWRITYGCSLLAGTLAMLSLIEYLFQIDLRITELVIPVAWQDAGYSGRMSLNAAGALLLCCLMLVTIGHGLQQKVEGYAFANMLGLLVALFSLLSLMTFFSTMDVESGWGKLTVMTPHAALGFTLLGFSAAIFRWPEDAEDNVDIAHLQNMVITYVSAGVLVTMLFSAAIGLLPIYDLLQSDPLYEAAKTLKGSAETDTLLASHEHLGSALRRQVALTGITALLLAYIGGFGVWRLLRPLTGRILMRADALEKAIQKATGELEVSVNNLQRSNRQLDQFARVASHDLQAPLHGITGFAQLLSQRYASVLGQEGNEFLEFISGGARQMQAQISGLLALSRVNSRAQPTIPVQTAEVVSQVLDTLQADIEQAGARVHHQDLPVILGDRTQIALLLQNLIANAIKFRRAGIAPEVTISAQREGTFWRFSVQDNGIGIDSTHREAIFEIFRRLHTQDEYPGTGIGLALCKEIVERHGGVIAVESQPGEGCKFTFTLPAIPETQA
jgi:signal transduction histidine kinase